jgi:hypothetical protein
VRKKSKPKRYRDLSGNKGVGVGLALIIIVLIMAFVLQHKPPSEDNRTPPEQVEKASQ